MSNQASLGDISSSKSSDKESENSGDDWTSEKIGDIFEGIKSGGTPKRGKEKYWGDGEIPFVKIEDLNRQQGEGISDAKEYTTQQAIEDGKTRIYDPGTILLTIYGTLGETGIVTEPVSTNQGIIGLWDPKDTNIQFARYALDFEQDRLASKKRETTQANIGKNILKLHEIPHPPKDEQRRIASVLYNVDQAISKTEEIIEQTQRVKKGLMQDLFTEGYYSHEEFQETRLGPKKIEIPKEWEITRFRDVSEVQQGLQIAKSKRHKKDGENRYRYITVQHLKDPEDEKQRWFIEDPREKVICTEEDVLMTRTGNTGQVVTDVEGVFHNNFFKVDFDRELLNKKFLVAYLRSEMVQNLLISYAGITTIPDLNHADFGRIPLLVPPKEEQEKIADSLISLEEKIQQEKEQKEQLQRLKKGLMQDLLTGSVRTGEDVRVLDEVVEVEG